MAAPSEGFVDAGELRLHYLEWGDTGPPAVLLHATGFLARLWEPIAEALSERFHVYAYDARGHGDSDKSVLSSAEGPDNGYTWDRFVADLRGFLDALDLRRALLIGHSGGGAAAAHLAATQPDYVSAAVLIEPIIFPPQADSAGEQRGEQLISGAARRRMVWPSREELIRSYHSRPPFADWREDVLRLYAEHGTFRRDDGQFELKCPGEIEAQIYGNSRSLDTWQLLPEIRCPTLVLHGEHTEEPLMRVAQGAARIPNSRLVAVAGTGHLLPMERPNAVLAEVLTFLDQEVDTE